jgi:hypothetical protein
MMRLYQIAHAVASAPAAADRIERSLDHLPRSPGIVVDDWPGGQQVR